MEPSLHLILLWSSPQEGACLPTQGGVSAQGLRRAGCLTRLTQGGGPQSVRPAGGRHVTGPELLTCQVPVFLEAIAFRDLCSRSQAPGSFRVGRPSGSTAPTPPAAGEGLRAREEDCVTPGTGLSPTQSAALSMHCKHTGYPHTSQGHRPLAVVTDYLWL